ncbi:MAG: DUF927 domain-containing protein, partial [Candidatus Competibacteraceae bacterium]|nr:DUF927 domain-containing protein [Candidatus Competibacteraceae bacterium]
HSPQCDAWGSARLGSTACGRARLRPGSERRLSRRCNIVSNYTAPDRTITASEGSTAEPRYRNSTGEARREAQSAGGRREMTDNQGEKVSNTTPAAWAEFQELVPSESIPATWVCDKDGVRNTVGKPTIADAPIGVYGSARNASGGGWQLMLAFVDQDGILREMTIDRSSLGSPRDVLRRLLDGGARVHPTDGAGLVDYLNAFRPGLAMRLVNQPGWVGDPFTSPCFVYPPELMGELEGGETITYEPLEGSRVHEALAARGDLKQWIRHVAKPVRGLPLPMFGLCAALAAPLAHLVGGESMGWHFFAETSRGKTTLLQVCASVFGRGTASGGAEASLVQSWNTTDNAIELAAHACNDLVLVLDELKAGEVDSMGKIIYMLSQGEGKGRMDRNLRRATQYRWRTTVLSSGEMSVRSAMRANKKDTHAGQEVRLVGIPVEDGDYGPEGGKLVNDLKKASSV